MLVVFACVAAVATVLMVTVGASPGRMPYATLPVQGPAARTSGDEPAAGEALRDPFVRPAIEESDPVPLPAAAPRAKGLAGLSMDDIAVRGVLLVPHGRSVGFLQGPDSKQYVVQAGDRLRDGVVDAIIAGAVVILPDQGSGGAGDARAAARRSLRVRPEEK